MNLRTLRKLILVYAFADFLIGYAGVFPITNLVAAQFTTVTGTVVDPHGVPYAFGTIAPRLIQAVSGTPVFIGTSTPYIQPSQASGLDSTGHFILTIADNTQISPAGSTWNFTVCSFQGTVGPAFGTGSNCFSLPAGITISGATQDISTQLNASATSLTLPFSNAGTGCTVAPLNNQSIVFISASNCTTATTLQYFPSGSGGEIITKSAGTATPAIQINALTSGNAQMNVTTTGVYGLFQTNSGAAWAYRQDTATTPINYTQFISAIGNGVGITALGNGYEFSGNGDVGGSGSAAGFKVTNAASTIDQSPGANNSFTAGNSVGGTANSSHGGDNSITSGNYTGAGNNRGGDIILAAGNTTGTGRGGNITMTTGTSTGGAAGVVTVNGTVFPQPTILQQFTTVLGSNVPLPNSNTSIIAQAITFPSSGCPCRVVAHWNLYLTTANSGFDAAYVCDTAAPTCTGANGFAPGSTTTTGSSNAFGMTGSGTSTITYANGASVTFTLVGAGTHGGGGSTVTTTPSASPAISLTGLPNSEMNLLVMSSN